MPSPITLNQIAIVIPVYNDWTAVQRLLGSAHLVTLTGAGGVGKSCLALHLAATVLDDHPDGVWHIDLTPVADPRRARQRPRRRAMGLRRR